MVAYYAYCFRGEKRAVTVRKSARWCGGGGMWPARMLEKTPMNSSLMDVLKRVEEYLRIQVFSLTLHCHVLT